VAPMPASPADREALYLAESDLLRAGKVRDDGNLVEASRLIEGVHATARRLDDRVLDARASMLAAEIARDKGDMAQSERDAVDAWSAASVSGDTNLTLRAQLVMLLATGSHSKRALEAFSGLGNVPDSADGAHLISLHGDALMAVGRFQEGEAEYRRAQAMRERVLPTEHVDRALGRQRIGAALAVQKRAAEALPILTETTVVLEQVFPPLRREAIEGVRYLAMTESELGHHERAAELYRDVYERRAKVLGPNGGLALDARKDYARALCDLGEDDRCMRELEETIAGFVELAGDRTSNVADARVTLANHLISAGRIADADAQLARALPVLEKIHGAESPYAMVAQYAQVRSWTERPKPINLDAAAKTLDRIEPVFAKLFGARSHPVGAVLSSRGRIALAKRDAKGADALMQRAIAMIGDEHRTDRAEAELFHADVLAALGKRDAARAIADAAANDYEAAGKGFAERAAAARAWPARPRR
jgi:tetratricopeptide (TPR) repeat protein